MAFPREILVAGINIADSLTAGAQTSVTHYPFVSANRDGDVTYGTGVPVSCVLDLTRRQVQTPSGRVQTVVATLTFPRGGLNIGAMDKIVLPDGTTGPLILDSPDAVFDPITGRGFITTVRIGEAGHQSGL